MSAAACSRDAKVHKKNEIPAEAAQKLWHIACQPLQLRLVSPKLIMAAGWGVSFLLTFNRFHADFL